MKNDFGIDVNEVKEFIAAAAYPVRGGSNSCIDRMSEDIDDEYLMERGAFFKCTAEHSEEFAKALSSVSVLYETDQCEKCTVRKYCNHYIAEKRAGIDDKDSLKMIDLFCGAGGLSLGFAQEGFVTALANDIEPCCVDTYAHNHPEIHRSRIILGDVKQLVRDIDKLLPDKDIDIIVGGPPCQGFSMANRQRLIDDPRNHLYKSYVEAVQKVAPPFFVMENVKGMLSVAKQVIEDFEAIGYKVSARVLNAKDFGVPQNRERLIYIGNRIGMDNDKIFDEIAASASSMEPHALSDALYGLQPLKASRTKNSTEIAADGSGARIARGLSLTNPYIDLINRGRKIDVVCNHKARYNNDRDIEIYGRLRPGDRSDDPKIADIMPYANRSDIFKDKYFKLEPDKVCKTITAHMKFDCNMYIHPSQSRGLTPREAARVQSFPDDYYFRGAYTKTYMQIGNSVPPLLGRAIAAVLKKYIDKEK
ncbi:MAG: DNA cytosine methyltransferase [Oscillospiraceae bacterium]